MLALKNQGVLMQKPLLILLDSRSTSMLIKISYFPFGVIPKEGIAKMTTTTSRMYRSIQSVVIENLKFPEFNNNCIHSISADVFDSPNCRYNIIMGRDLINPDRMALVLNFNTSTITWGKLTIPMKSTHMLRPISSEEEIWPIKTGHQG